MSHVYRVPAADGFTFKPESVILSARLLRKGRPIKDVVPKVEGLSVSCVSPIVEPGDELEIAVDLAAMSGAHKR